MRKLDYRNLNLPANLIELGAPDAALGPHAAREGLLWLAIVLSGGVGVAGGLSILLRGGSAPGAALALVLLFVGGGAALFLLTLLQKLSGKALLVYLDCLVLLDYEKSRVVTVADRKELSLFAAPWPGGEEALLAELSRLSLVEAPPPLAVAAVKVAKPRDAAPVSGNETDSGGKTPPPTPTQPQPLRVMGKVVGLSLLSLIVGFVLFSQIFRVAVSSMGIGRVDGLAVPLEAPGEPLPGEAPASIGTTGTGPPTAPNASAPAAPSPGAQGPGPETPGRADEATPAPGPTPVVIATPAPQRIYSPYETPAPPAEPAAPGRG